MIIKKKRHVPIFTIILLLFALFLSACSQSKDAQITTEEIAETKTTSTNENDDTLAPDDSSDLSKDDNSENNINQEQEWINNVLSNDTNEIKIIVYNYENNKNILVRNGDKVPFSKESDTLAFLIPMSENSMANMNMRFSSLFDSFYSTETNADDGMISMQAYFTTPICDDESFLFHINFVIDEKPIDYYITLNFREGAEEKAKEYNMDSTLPGLEWIATLDNIITQPTAIIYNDKTNKKILIEDKDEFFLSDPDDVIAYYSPNADIYPLNDWSFSLLFENSWVGSDELPDASNSMRKILCYQTQLNNEPTNYDAMVSGHSDIISFPVTFDSAGLPEASLEFSLYTPY